jgi:predicted secreted protein
MCGENRHRGGSDGRKALVPESRGAGTGALKLDWAREAPAGRDRRGFPIPALRAWSDSRRSAVPDGPKRFD